LRFDSNRRGNFSLPRDSRAIDDIEAQGEPRMASRSNISRMSRRSALIASLLAATSVGCRLGPQTIERNRLSYNEAVKETGEQQLLLNIVRLRYIHNPSSLAVTSIADQHEVVSGLQLTPFFQAAAAGNVTDYASRILPGGSFGGATRPTLSYTPLDDSEFTRRLFTPITLEGVTYLTKTTWPISTVFRLWLENLNWVSNAETASGPTPRMAPDYEQFLSGVEAMQRLQDRKALALIHIPREEELSDPLTDEAAAATAVDAAKEGMQLRRHDRGWVVTKKKMVPTLRLPNLPDNDADLQDFCRAFYLDPSLRDFELTIEEVDPFYRDAPVMGLTKLDLEPRSLLQVLYFLAQGVDTPTAHQACGNAPETLDVAGQPFDWNLVLDGLFHVHCCTGHYSPAGASVAVWHQGAWYYIDDRDRDSKATFSLVMEMSRLELDQKAGAAPLLTLPLGR
jgi:hypothetical protein